MRTTPDREASLLASARVISTNSPEFSCSAGTYVPSAATSAWFSANDPIAYPFRLSRPVVVKKLGFMNGTSIGGNVDVGVYDAAWTRLVSCGSTAAAGSQNSWQWVDVTDTALQAGQLYYLAGARDNTTAARAVRWAPLGTAAVSALLGTQDSSTDAFPLPDPLTNMAANGTAASIFLLAMKCQETVF